MMMMTMMISRNSI